jgi:hypothetical protein
MRLAQAILQLLVGVVLRRILDKIQHGAEALLGQGVDDVVEHLLLVVHPLDSKPGLGDSDQASVFSAQNCGRRREEPPLLGCSLSVVVGHQCKDVCKNIFRSTHKQC